MQGMVGGRWGIRADYKSDLLPTRWHSSAINYILLLYLLDRCQPKDRALITTKINQFLRKEGKSRPHASAGTIVKEALRDFLPEDAPVSSLPSVAGMVRKTNRARQRCRPKHPNSLEFEWVEEALPSAFKQQELRVGTARHVFFFTAFMLTLLQKCSTWYVAATFKAVQKPFYQLWSIHTFVRQNSCLKQVPVLLVVMSRRTKADYRAILEFVITLLATPPSSVVMDFESAVWCAFREVFSSIRIRGCFFHWKQAVWRKMKELMSLPFLPAEQIVVTFEDFCNTIQLTREQGFHLLMEYMESTWINGAIFPPSTWSVYGHAVRTNNDVEGWHHGLNRMVARRRNENVNLNLYELVDVLHETCVQVQTDCKMVSEEKLKKHQRKAFLEYQAKGFELWDKYERKELRPTQLLRQVSSLHAPEDDLHEWFQTPLPSCNGLDLHPVHISYVLNLFVVITLVRLLMLYIYIYILYHVTFTCCITNLQWFN